MTSSVNDLRAGTLGFIKAHKLDGETIGAYRYSSACSAATLYSSSYAAMTCSLYNDLETLSSADKAEWAEYLNSHQDDDDDLFPIAFDVLGPEDIAAVQ